MSEGEAGSFAGSDPDIVVVLVKLGVAYRSVAREINQTRIRTRRARHSPTGPSHEPLREQSGAQHAGLLLDSQHAQVLRHLADVQRAQEFARHRVAFEPRLFRKVRPCSFVLEVCGALLMLDWVWFGGGWWWVVS